MKSSIQVPSHSFISVILALAFAQNVFAADVDAGDQSSSTKAAALEQKFLEGLNQRESGDYEASINAFQGILSSEPTLNRARAELAVSYFRSLNFAAARAEAEKVLADQNTPEGVKVTVAKFLEVIAKESRKHVFTPYVNVGFGHDDNINVGPSSNTINLGNAVFVANSLPISESFALLNVGLSHRYLSPTPIKMFSRSAAYIWQSNVNYYRNDYNNAKDYDLDVLSISTGPLAVVAERWRGGVDFTLDHILLGGSTLASFYGVSPSVTWNVSKNTDITLNGKFQKRDFDNTAAPGRDSDYQTVGISAGKAFLEAKLAVQVGASLFNENADINRFSNQGSQFSAGASYRAWNGGSVYVKDAYKHSDFDGKEVLFNVARNEYENRATVGFNHQFSQNLVKDWTIDVNATYTTNAANLSIYDYRRTQYSLTMGKYF